MDLEKNTDLNWMYLGLIFDLFLLWANGPILTITSLIGVLVCLYMSFKKLKEVW